MNKLNILLHFFWLHGLLFFYNIAAENTGQIVFRYLDCAITSSKVRKCEGGITKVDNVTALNMEIEFSEDLTTPSAITSFNLEQNGGRNFNIFNIKFDLCKIFKQLPKRGILQSFWKRVIAASDNLPKKCPIKKDIVYKFKDMYVGTDIVPSYLPLINFSSKTDIFQGSESIITVTTMGMMCREQYFCKHFTDMVKT